MLLSEHEIDKNRRQQTARSPTHNPNVDSAAKVDHFPPEKLTTPGQHDPSWQASHEEARKECCLWTNGPRFGTCTRRARASGRSPLSCRWHARPSVGR